MVSAAWADMTAVKIERTETEHTLNMFPPYNAQLAIGTELDTCAFDVGLHDIVCKSILAACNRPNLLRNGRETKFQPYPLGVYQIGDV
jgi:hypothetical protein